jgi:glycosyltransferase involved in cell wall biosynthesis
MEVFQIGFSDPRENPELERWAGISVPWKVFPTARTVTDQYANQSFIGLASKICPDIVIVVADPWNIDHILVNSPAPTILVLHIEGAPLPTKVSNNVAGVKQTVNIPQVLLHANMVVTAGPFARKTIQDRLGQYAMLSKRSEIETQAIMKNTSCIIPDMVDTTVFTPLDKIGLKGKLLKIPDDAFVVGFFGRQNPRKGLPYIIKAFSQWRDRPDNAYLYLHTAVKDVFGWNLLQLLVDYKINEKTIIDRSMPVGGGCSDEVLNMYYNTCFVEGTPVRCEDGYRPIEGIFPGMNVLSANGVLREVTDRVVLPYIGQLVRVATSRSEKVSSVRLIISSRS